MNTLRLRLCYRSGEELRLAVSGTICNVAFAIAVRGLEMWRVTIDGLVKYGSLDLYFSQVPWGSTQKD